MATYKVPQDVEADDKLIGPFSFRQFIYLIIVVLAGVGAWGLAQLFIGLVIIPLPIIVFFGVLALPLRKDQPMEIYMAAIVSFYLKPRKRLWDPEGIETLIEITAPKTYEDNRTKGLSQSEAEQRLGYLATIVDSGGWAIRGANVTQNNTVINNDIYLEAQSAVDVLDANTSIAQSFNQLMVETSTRTKEEAVERMKAAVFAPTPPPAPAMQIPTPVAADDIELPDFDPYPTNIQQTVIQPLNDPSHQADQHIEQKPNTSANKENSIASIAAEAANLAKASHRQTNKPQQSPVTTSETPIPADIINLANNADGLSIETIAHEANRIHKKLEDESQEVFVSLR